MQVGGLRSHVSQNQKPDHKQQKFIVTNSVKTLKMVHGKNNLWKEKKKKKLESECHFISVIIKLVADCELCKNISHFSLRYSSSYLIFSLVWSSCDWISSQSTVKELSMCLVWIWHFKTINSEVALKDPQVF